MEEKSLDSRYARPRVSRMPAKIGLRGSCVWVATLAVAVAVGCAPVETKDDPWFLSETAYTRQEARLFDDLFRPELFGVTHTVSPPERDKRLGERTAFADSVSQAKVITVTRGGGLDATVYTIVLRPDGRPLAGRRLPETLTLTIRPSSPIYSWLEAAGQTWVGTRLILFVRAFTDGIHYHATVDTEPVRKVIEHATVMQVLDR